MIWCLAVWLSKEAAGQWSGVKLAYQEGWRKRSLDLSTAAHRRTERSFSPEPVRVYVFVSGNWQGKLRWTMFVPSKVVLRFKLMRCDPFLRSYPDLHVVGEAADGRAGIEAVRTLRPHVVLMDVNMPVMDGIKATACIKCISHRLFSVSRRNPSRHAYLPSCSAC